MTKKFSIQWFDELNNIVAYQFENNRENLKSIVKTLLIDAYKRGWDDVEDMLDYELVFGIPMEVIDKAIERPIDGKTTNDRVAEYMAQDDGLTALQRVVTNECHRVYNQGALETAQRVQEESGLIVNKTWRTMKDDRVRDSHVYLEGMVVRLGERFYTWDGDSAEYPGQFENPENSINCRCYIEYSTEGDAT